jgi:HlyD family secretion protein
MRSQEAVTRLRIHLAMNAVSMRAQASENPGKQARNVMQFTSHWQSIVGKIAAIATVMLMGCAGPEQLIAVGILERDRIELTTTFQEPIIAHHVREGDRITAGTLVSEQSADRIGAQLSQAQAVRDQSAARLAELIRGPRRELIREAMARLEGAEALRRDADLELARVTDLVAKRFASVAQLDQLRAQRDSAVAALAQAQAALDSLLSGTTAEELEQARHALAGAQAQVAATEANIARLRHIAPTDSFVEALPYETGETPPIGAPIAVLLRAGKPYARVYVPEAIRVHVRAGDSAEIRIDGIGQPFQGHVRFIASDASFTPYFALTRYDRGRLVFVAEIDLEGADDLPAGTPLEATFAATHD